MTELVGLAPATAEQIGSIAELFRAESWPNPARWIETDLQEDEVVLAATSGSQVVGGIFGRLSTYAGYGMGQYLAVATAHRGQGIGRLLMTGFEGECARLGLGEVRLVVLHAAPERVRFFESCGYRTLQADGRLIMNKTF